MSEDTREWARPMLCGDPEGLERHGRDLIHCARKMREKEDEEAADAVEQHAKEMTDKEVARTWAMWDKGRAEMTHDTFNREHLNDPTSLMEDDKPKVGPASLMHILGEAASEAEEERRGEMDELRKENRELMEANDYLRKSFADERLMAQKDGERQEAGAAHLLNTLKEANTQNRELRDRIKQLESQDSLHPSALPPMYTVTPQAGCVVTPAIEASSLDYIKSKLDYLIARLLEEDVI